MLKSGDLYAIIFQNKIIIWGVFMRIAICDDEKVFRDILKKELENYAKEFGFDFVYTEFSSGENLLSSENDFDLIFMDYQMKTVNGIDTVDKMRKHNDKTVVIFITSYPHVAIESIKVQPHRFLTKPINHKDFYEALDSFMERYNSDAYVLLYDEENDKMKRVAEWDILYAEADNIYCKVITYENCYLYKNTLSDFAKKLRSDFFYRAHRSYLVNMNHIDTYSHSEIVLENGEKALLTKTKHFDFQKTYMAFLKRRNKGI